MNSGSMRVACRNRLHVMLDARLTGIQVMRQEPSIVESQSLFLGATQGLMATGALKSGRKNRHDDFSIAVHCIAWSPGEPDSGESDLLVAAMWDEVDDLVATSPFLSIDGNGLEGLTSCTISGDVSGPTPGPFVVNEEPVGYGSELIGLVLFKTYLNQPRTEEPD